MNSPALLVYYIVAPFFFLFFFCNAFKALQNIDTFLDAQKLDRIESMAYLTLLLFVAPATSPSWTERARFLCSVGEFSLT